MNDTVESIWKPWDDDPFDLITVVRVELGLSDNFKKSYRTAQACKFQ